MARIMSSPNMCIIYLDHFNSLPYFIPSHLLFAFSPPSILLFAPSSDPWVSHLPCLQKRMHALQMAMSLKKVPLSPLISQYLCIKHFWMWGPVSHFLFHNSPLTSPVLQRPWACDQGYCDEDCPVTSCLVVRVPRYSPAFSALNILSSLPLQCFLSLGEGVTDAYR